MAAIDNDSEGSLVDFIVADTTYSSDEVECGSDCGDDENDDDAATLISALDFDVKQFGSRCDVRTGVRRSTRRRKAPVRFVDEHPEFREMLLGSDEEEFAESIRCDDVDAHVSCSDSDRDSSEEDEGAE